MYNTKKCKLNISFVKASVGRSKGSSNTFGKKTIQTDESFEPWKSKKAAILSKYTTSERLTFMSFDLSPAEKAALKGPTSVTEKVSWL